MLEESFVESGVTEDGIEWGINADFSHDSQLDVALFGNFEDLAVCHNGYVKLPRNHPGGDFNVHGGITYSNQEGWIGFDTHHLGDIWLAPNQTLKDYKTRHGLPDETEPYRLERVWTKEKVIEETLKLAKQVAETSGKMNKFRKE